jgi:hypothetical protein
MTAPHIIAARQQAALTELTAILERHDPEAAHLASRTNHDRGVPTSPKSPLETVTYLAESTLILAKIVDEQLTPRRRGRPRKPS